MSVSNLNSLWQQVLSEVEKSGQFDPATFHSWIEKTNLCSVQDHSAYISYPSIVSLQVLEKQKPLFSSILTQLFGKELQLVLISRKEEEKLLQAPLIQPSAAAVKGTDLSSPFQPQFTFESFVEGSSNSEAYAACFSSCTQKTPLFNPLMLYGNSGLGKTHLLHAVGNYLKEEKPDARVIYMYSGDLVSCLLEAMRNKNLKGMSVDDVKRAMTECDYFLIDDIQNLKNNASQEVFFTVYNALIAQGTQIILTSDLRPGDLSNLEARLISRFQQGLCVHITSPEFITSKAILQKKLEGQMENCAISEDVIDYLASKFSCDVRMLEGKLNTLVFKSINEHVDIIDLKFAKKLFQEEESSSRNSDEITLKDIKKAVTGYFNLAYKDLEGKSRQKQIAIARHCCVYLSRQILQAPYASIGKELGGRDHKTISSSYERAVSLLAKDSGFQSAVEKIRHSLE